MLNNDYKEMLLCLKQEGVRFLLVGAYALGAHGYPRSTGDIDIWIEPSKENSANLIHALKKFGAPVTGLSEKDFQKKNTIFQIGVAPCRIDIITGIDGVAFDKAYTNRETISLDGVKFPVLSLEDLIKNKKSTGREKDLLDAKELGKLKKTKQP